MTRQTGTFPGTSQRNSQSSAQPADRDTRRLLAAGLVGGLIGVLALAQPAAAQAVNGVVIDLSVIGDGGVGGAAGTPFAGDGKLQLPPKSNVRSRLYLKPKAPAAPMVAKPRSTPSSTSAKPKMAAAPKPAPKAAAAPPQPIAKPAPKPKVETAAAPPPKPPAKPMAKPAEPKTEMTAKAPPPPPPTTNAPPAPPASAAPPPPAPAAAETAAAPAQITVKPGRALRIAFAEGDAKLPAGADADLNALANAIRDNKEYRVQLMAFAAAKDISTSKARRLSLSRALTVRSFLIDKGVRSTQIDVRALGNKTAEKPANRVDVNIAQR